VFRPRERRNSLDRLERTSEGVFSDHAAAQVFASFLFLFPLLTLPRRPASLQLPQTPRAIYSSPDGSCILAVQEEGGKRSITAYHWSTFASNRGISVTLPDFPVDLEAALLTSVVNQNNIHLIGLDISSLSCRSVVLDITLKATEFTFQERGPKVLSRRGKQTAHNCLIDCHRDVWTHFPVVAAVKRHSITSSSQRQQKTLVFVTDDDRRPFSSHFSDMISAFEKLHVCQLAINSRVLRCLHGISWYSTTTPIQPRLDGLAFQSWRVAGRSTVPDAHPYSNRS
jgi:hypothetical protein